MELVLQLVIIVKYCRGFLEGKIYSSLWSNGLQKDNNHPLIAIPIKRMKSLAGESDKQRA